MQSDASMKSGHLIKQIWNMVILMVIMSSKHKILQCYMQCYFGLYIILLSLKSSMCVISILSLNSKYPCEINIKC